jgi:hypothetical protein
MKHLKRKSGCSLIGAMRAAAFARDRCATSDRVQTTVAEQRALNIHVHDGISEDAFVAMRTARDATLDVPTLILPSIQVNVRGGQLPPPDDNGVAYLRIPLNALPVHPHLESKQEA